LTTSLASWFRPADPAVRAALGAMLAVVVFLLAWAALHRGFYAGFEIVDTPVYQKYGDWMADGQVPYRDFRPEYPPAALPAFVLPSLIASEGATLDDYSRIFETLMAVCGAAAVALVASTLRSLGAGGARFAAALTFTALAPLALGTVVLSRFDLLPAALTAGALAAFVAGRDRIGAGTLALAIAAKIYPGVLVPLAAAWIWRRRGRREALVCGGVFVGVLAACFLPFVLIAPEGVAASLGRQLSRPLQIESLGSAVLLATGANVEMESGHGSQNIAGTPGLVVGIVATAVQALALLGIWAAFVRGPMDRERLVRFAAAAVIAFIAFGKVLSPQFLIWLVPLVPLVRGLRGLAASGLLALGLVLTQLWFPSRYWDFALSFDETLSWLVLARDLALVAALVALVYERRDTTESSPDGRGQAARRRLVGRDPEEPVVLGREDDRLPA
jgi:Glycosyltransferase family 87